MKLRPFSSALAAILLAASATSLAGAAGRSTTISREHRAFFDAHCIHCHGAETQEGEVRLDQLPLEVDDLAAASRWLKVVEVLDAGYMPPEDEPSLNPQARQRIVSALQDELHSAITSLQPFAPTPIRRMNRFQYSNAVQDLFDLKVDVFALPERMLREYGYFRPETGQMPESLRAGSRPLGKSQLIDGRLAGVSPFPQDLRAENGFDNRGDHLSLSPLLLESFFKLSQSIVHSDDFHAQTCGIWNDFFLAPSGNENIEAAVEERLQNFLTRAFRQPVDDALLDRYVAHVKTRIQSGEPFTDAMKAAASAALVSPRFLYLYQSGSDRQETRLLDDFELAARLSFFLWGSIPDETLLNLAADGSLRDPVVLQRQLERMLSDKRLKRFCDSFPSQWLQLERIIASIPDEKLYPDFYFGPYRASMHMMLEPLLLFETILVENRSILELIDSDFSYRSNWLESWYETGRQPAGRITPTAIAMRRVPLTDRRQGGVITCAAVMTMTSAPARTQPITRGAWIASVIFNDPPQPPPANVPPLEEEGEEDSTNLTLRERFRAHRERADCAGCHSKIDPLGFALENYGPTGIWRDQYENGRPVDASGVLFRKHNFANVVQFKDAILAESDRFTRALAAHMLSFALGRQVTAADSPALDRIVRETAAAGYRIKPLIKQVVLSEPFLQDNNQ